MPKILVNCLNCNNKFYKLSSEIKRNKRHFCCKKCFKTFSKGKNHPHYKGGHINKLGYKLISIKGICYMEHRLVMEQYLKRKLKPFPLEMVHHKNGNPLDNRISNLKLINGSGNHLSQYHSYKRIFKNNLKQCSICHKFLPLKRYSKEKSVTTNLRNDCKSCQNERNKKRLKLLNSKYSGIKFLSKEVSAIKQPQTERRWSNHHWHY